METMKHARLISYKNIQIEEVEKPKPKAGEVLIKVKKCGVCGSDVSAYYGKHTYIPFPIVLGHEFSGDIAEIGEGVVTAPQALKNSTYRELFGTRRTIPFRSSGVLTGFLELVTSRKERVQLPTVLIPIEDTRFISSCPTSLFR